MYLTRKFKFDAAHELPGYKGKCSNLHGHTWRLEVEVKGEPDISGMIIDFSILDKMVQTLIIDRLDHSFINDTIKNPTAENMIYWIVIQLKELSPLSTRPILSRVRLYETENSYAEWRKE